MRNTPTLMSLLLVTILLLPLVVLGANGAMLYVGGTTTLNGMEVGRSSAVFTGDKIQTSEKGAATLIAPGTSAVLAASSDAVYQGQSIFLNYGGLAINTTAAMRVQANTVTVSPVSKTAKFEMIRTGGAIAVTVLMGAVTINDGSTSSALAKGQSVSIPDQSPDEKDKKKKKRATQPALRSKGVIVGMIAGAGAVAAIAAWSSGSPASCTNPD